MADKRSQSSKTTGILRYFKMIVKADVLQPMMCNENTHSGEDVVLCWMLNREENPRTIVKALDAMIAPMSKAPTVYEQCRSVLYYVVSFGAGMISYLQTTSIDFDNVQVELLNCELCTYTMFLEFDAHRKYNRRSIEK
jgi:hypothetical protein